LSPCHVIHGVAVGFFDGGRVDGGRALTIIPVLDEAIIAAADKNVWILGVVLDAHDRRGGGELELGVVGVLSKILKSQCPSI
jgi:hypothetical protein